MNITDLLQIGGQFPHLQKIFADGGYDGKDFIAAVKQSYQLDWEFELIN
ncbi:MAG: hypothetical protein JO235_17425 [Chroococcidiopsidaceae cyanobacterium CP_BM_RX_35]|nr:hypothetical protein [Chroococcidiopsidaceae cyanobacterium CP_BM_RX_35]